MKVHGVENKNESNMFLCEDAIKPVRPEHKRFEIVQNVPKLDKQELADRRKHEKPMPAL
jgi:hypothetical protein